MSMDEILIIFIYLMLGVLCQPILILISKLPINNIIIIISIPGFMICTFNLKYQLNFTYISNKISDQISKFSHFTTRIQIVFVKRKI